MSQPFARAIAMVALIQAAMSGNNPQVALAGIPAYRSRGKGEGLAGNKHAKSSFKQNKRRGL